MLDLLKDLRSAILPILTTLGLGVASTVLAFAATPQGDVPVSKSIALGTLGWVASVFVGLFTWAIKLWLRDLKRARIRFAKEMGRKICPCTQTGEIMLHERRKVDDGGAIPTIRCPHCGNWEIYDHDTTE